MKTNVIVRTKTIEEWNAVQEKAFEFGIYWCTGSKELLNVWEEYGEDSVLIIREDALYKRRFGNWKVGESPKEFAVLSANEYINQSKAKFKVGDVVRCINPTINATINSRLNIGEIYKVESLDNTFVRLEGLEYDWFASRFELAEETANDEWEYAWACYENEHKLFVKPNQKVEDKLITKGKNFMSNIIETAKNLTLSPEEKLLRRVELKNDRGDYTEEAIRIILQELCKEREDKLIEVAKAQEEEDKKK